MQLWREQLPGSRLLRHKTRNSSKAKEKRQLAYRKVSGRPGSLEARVHRKHIILAKKNISVARKNMQKAYGQIARAPSTGRPKIIG